MKTFTINSNGSASGTLSDGKQYTTVVPVQLTNPALLPQLQKEGVEISANPPGTSFGSEVLTWVILLLPFILSSGCGAGCQKGRPVSCRERLGPVNRGPRSSMPTVLKRLLRT